MHETPTILYDCKETPYNYDKYEKTPKIMSNCINISYDWF